MGDDQEADTQGGSAPDAGSQGKAAVPSQAVDSSADSLPANERPATSPSWFKRKRAEVFYEPDDKNAFPERLEELQELLSTGDAELAADILAEAKESHDRHKERVEGAERRATTLQGASAIAAGLTLAAAGLLLDPTQLTGWGWRLLFGGTVTYVTFALGMCAWRATLASSRVHRWVTPPDRDVLCRSEQTLAEARTERAASILHSLGANARFARYKVTMLRAAAEWIVRALAALLVLAVLSLAYALFGEDQSPDSAVLPSPPATQRSEPEPTRTVAPDPPAHEPSRSPAP